MATDNQSSNTSLPAITLVALIGLIAALVYIGYGYVTDDAKGFEELTNVALDTASQQPLTQNDPEMLMSPEDTNTSTQPAPVDLSQATPPADAPEASAEDVAADNRETTGGKPASTEKPKVEVKKVEPPKEEKKVEKPKEDVAVVKPSVKSGGQSSTYTVESGETFYSVANRYNMKLSTLKAMNPGVTENSVKSGSQLKVKVMAVHTVGPGDVLRVVAQKYGVSKEALMKANKKTKDMATRGEKLIIPFPEKQ